MTKGQRAIATLLAIVAALLVVNIVAELPGQAAAAVPRPPEPKVVHATVEVGAFCGATGFNQRHYTRYWDDGTIDITTRCVNPQACLDLGDTEQTCGTTIIVPGF